MKSSSLSSAMNFGSKNVLASVILSSITNASAEYICPSILQLIGLTFLAQQKGMASMSRLTHGHRADTLAAATPLQTLKLANIHRDIAEHN